MGVYGLTTYLRENTQFLSNTVQFPSASGDVVPIVVDGWSFIYTLYEDSNLPWIYGGEYPEFSKLITRVVETWIQLGLKIYFVFDGTYPDLKAQKIIERLERASVQTGLLFFQLPAASRSRTGFLHENRLLPPMCYSACIYTLEELARDNEALEVHCADEEGDPYSVELAGRVGGYVVGSDSDFVILNATGYLGYIPLDGMVWESVTLGQSLLASNGPGGASQVWKPKWRQNREASTRGGLIPLDGAQDLRLSCTVYHPDILASHLSLPVTLLPLLGALVGNDFIAPSKTDHLPIRFLLFEKGLTVIQRIERAAATLRHVLLPTTPRKNDKHRPTISTMDLIDRTVNLLMSRLTAPLSSADVDEVIDKVVDATLQYAIPKHEGDTALWGTDICALHEPDLCPLLPPMSRRALEEGQEMDGQNTVIRDLYVQAYRRGDFSPRLMDVLSSGTSWPRLCLESPNLETISCSVTRPLRLWIFSILDDSLGLPIAERDSSGGATETAALVSIVSQGSGRVKVPEVTEYVRRDSKIAAEVLPIPPLSELLSSIPYAATDEYLSAEATTSLIQRLPDERFTIFLQVLESDLPIIRRVPSEQLQPVLAIRWIARCLHQRALETGSSDRQDEKWTSYEAHCFFATFVSQPSNLDVVGSGALPVAQDRNAHLAAQLMTVLEAIEHLSQALLLTSLVPPVAHRFSGKLLHAYLSGSLTLPDNGAMTEMWKACEEGLVGAFRADRTKGRKMQTGGDVATVTAPLVGHSTRGVGHSARRVGHSARGIGHSTRGAGHSARGIGHNAREVGYNAREVGYNVRGTGHNTRGVGHNMRGVGHNVRGVGHNANGAVRGWWDM